MISEMRPIFKATYGPELERAFEDDEPGLAMWATDSNTIYKLIEDFGCTVEVKHFDSEDITAEIIVTVPDYVVGSEKIDLYCLLPELEMDGQATWKMLGNGQYRVRY